MTLPVPILLRPALLSSLNAWRHSAEKEKTLFRDGVLLLFAIGLGIAIFRGTHFMLRQLEELRHYAYISPTLPLGLALLSLLAMLFVSSLVNAVGLFFFSDDIDLLLARPISRPKFFLQRLIHVVMATVWMPAIFILPLVIAYGVWFEQGVGYYVLSGLALIPYFVAPCALAAGLSAIVLSLFPGARARVLVVVVVMTFGVGIYVILDLLRSLWHSVNSTQELIRLLNLLTFSQITFLPSSWVTGVFREMVEVNHGDPWPYLAMLYAVLLASVSGAYLLLRLFHFGAYSKVSQTRSARARSGARGAEWWERGLWFLDQPTRALLVKDVRVLTRDVTQLVQLLLLAAIYLVYVYNLRIYLGFNQLVGSEDYWWRNFLFVANFCMCAFVTTALCTRFVFPSVSLEGRAIWLLFTSPLTVKSIVMTKFRTWAVVVVGTGIVISGTGILVAGGGLRETVVNCLAMGILCFGVAGLAMGLGARFSRFDWESPSQLAVGFGNLVFMLIATVQILLNLVPVWFILFVRPERVWGVSPLISLCFYIGALSLLLAMNGTIARLALAWGISGLEAKKR